MKHFFNILLLICIIFSLSQAVYAKNIEFIQITDLHYTESKESIDNFKNLIDILNSIKSLDFVVFTGDNIDKANVETLKSFLKLCKKIDVPYYIEIGNHDCFKSLGLDKKKYAELVKDYSSQNFKDFNFVIQKGTFAFIFIDGMKEVIPSMNGYYRDKELAWLDLQLTKNKNKNVIIFQHFPLIEFKPVSSHNLYLPENYIKVLSKHNNVMAIFAGHYHKTLEVEIGNIVHYVTPSAQINSKYFRRVVLIKNDKNKYEIYSTVQNF